MHKVQKWPAMPFQCISNRGGDGHSRFYDILIKNNNFTYNNERKKGDKKINPTVSACILNRKKRDKRKKL